MLTESSEVTIRRARSGDAELLAWMGAQTFVQAFAADNTPENMEAYLSAAFNLSQFKAELSDPRGIFYLVQADGRLAAYAKLFAGKVPGCITGADPIELVRFYVEQQWQGKGVASALMQECLREAKRQGFKTIYLGVWEHNLRAQAFYRKWDFVHVGEHIFQMGDDPQTDWWMMRKL